MRTAADEIVDGVAGIIGGPFATRSDAVKFVDAALRSALAAEREACAAICRDRAERQKLRAQAEGNEFAAERAIEAAACAADINSRQQ